MIIAKMIILNLIIIIKLKVVKIWMINKQNTLV